MSDGDRDLLRARDLVDREYRRPLAVTDMAEAAHLSPAHFSRRFRAIYGETPHVYLLTRRLERAAALLRRTDHPVTAICLEVGLSSVGSFSTSFTRVYGCSPSAYRAASPTAADRVPVPECIVRAFGRPKNSSSREATGSARA